MANYDAVTRTNYFRVTDEEEYARILSRFCSEDEIYDFSEKKEDGTFLHGFGTYGSLYYYPGEEEDEDPDIGQFFLDIQKILPDDEVFVLMEAGHEKLRYVVGAVDIVTSKEHRWLNLKEFAVVSAKEMLGDKFRGTDLEY